MYDSLLILTYGGPETVEQIRPFIQSVLGDKASEARVKASVARYEQAGGISPINEQSRALTVKLVNRMLQHPTPVPIYWATLHSNPTVEETVTYMAFEGRKNAAVFVPTPLESNYMTQKFRKALDECQALVPGTTKPTFTILPSYESLDEFVSCAVSTIQKGLQFLESQGEKNIVTLFTAHSLPKSWSETADYDARFDKLIQRVSKQIGLTDVVKTYQSKPEGSPGEWLGPNPADVVRELATRSVKPAVLIVPLGFSLDNMEVAYDLDYQLSNLCTELGLTHFRTSTTSAEPEFVEMIINTLYTESVSC